MTDASMHGPLELGGETFESASDQRTRSAFERFRRSVGLAREPRLVTMKNHDELDLMSHSDGLFSWVDGAKQNISLAIEVREPLRISEIGDEIYVWIVNHSVFFADIKSEFGVSRSANEVKHTNLTGGSAAFVGGELVFLDDDTVIINGWSGRYGPRSPEELSDAARAFCRSGYEVWFGGWDYEADRSQRFLGIRLERVQP